MSLLLLSEYALMPILVLVLVVLVTPVVMILFGSGSDDGRDDDKSYRPWHSLGSAYKLSFLSFLLSSPFPLRNGDVIQAKFTRFNESSLPPITSISNSSTLNGKALATLSSSPSPPNVNVLHTSHASELASTIAQDPLDSSLESQSGQISRSRSNFCRHSESGMCDYCMPLEPYDPTYLESEKIKHLSYHSYLKSIMTKSKTKLSSDPMFIPPLEVPDYRVKAKCLGHAPWPAGICTKCQPSAVTLSQQVLDF